MQLLTLAALAAVLVGCRAQPGRAEPVGLREVGSIALPGVEGRFDHFAVDVARKRLYVSALENNTLEVLDLSQDPGRHLRSIGGLLKPTGVAVMPELRRVAAASGDDGACRFFDADSLEPAGEVRGLDDADNVRYDATARLLYVGYGDGALAVIDPSTTRVIDRIKLPAHPESFQPEQHGRRIFVNLPDAGNSIAVVDREKRSVVATWRPKDAGANFPMALDEANHRLFVGCRRPAKLLVLDTDSGRTVAALDCVGDTDDLFYDADARRVYVSGGDGAVDVIDQRDADHYRRIGRVDTAPGVRTSLFVPQLRRLYVAVPHRNGRPATIRVFEAAPTAR